MKKTDAMICLMVLFLLACYHKNLAQENRKSKGEKERLDLLVDTCDNLIGVKSLPGQESPSFGERSSRAVFIPIVAGYLINKGVQGIQKMISDRKNKYIAQYSFSKLDHYFYDQVSTTSPFDPTGIQFKGFTIVRLLQKKNEPGFEENKQEDTVFYAKFMVDTSEGRCTEIMNNGIFRLKLDTIMITRCKVKAPKKVDKINLDFEIDFTATYRGTDGQMFQDVPIGKFLMPLREVPVYNREGTSRLYFDSIDSKKPSLTGQCFTVPRSIGFYKSKNGVVESCYGMGQYSVKVTVKETSKVKFIDKLIFLSSDPTLSIGSTGLQKKYGSGAPATAPASPKTTKK